MTNHEMGKAYILDASFKLASLGTLLQSIRFNLVVREAQETVELYLKGALRYVGVEPAKVHDVADILRSSLDRFPPWFQHEIEELATVSTRLARDRGPSYYGDESRGIPPSGLFNEESALAAIEDAKLVGRVCTRLIEEA